MTGGACRHLGLLLVAALLLPGSVPPVGSQTRPAPDPSETRRAIDQAVAQFAATDLEGRPVTIAGLRGKVVVLDFWATWCAPCLAEIPRLQRARASYGDRLAVVGVSIDTVSRADFISWLRRHRVDWPQVFDGRGWSSPVLAPFGIAAIPFSILVDPGGRVVGVNVTGDRLDRSLDALLGH